MMLKELAELNLDWFPSGSAYICNPPVLTNDFDFFILDPEETLHERLEKEGWKNEGSCVAGGRFRSYRSGAINLILVFDRTFFSRLKLATELAKRFNLLKKADRIALFDAVVDDYMEAHNMFPS